MSRNTKACVSMLCVTVIACVGLVTGHDGVLLSGAMALVAGIGEIYNQLEKFMVSKNSLREELVQFKRDCGQDILALKRKVNYLDSIQRRDDRSRY